MLSKFIDLSDSTQLYNLKDVVLNTPAIDSIYKGITIIKNKRVVRDINLLIRDDLQFSNALNKKAPFFRGFSLYDNGFMLAGGSVCNIIMGIEYIKDFDLFPIFHNKETIDQSITNLIIHLKKYLKENDSKLEIIKTKQALTIIYPSSIHSFEIQVICGIDIDFILKPKLEPILDILYNVCKLDETYGLEATIDINTEPNSTILTKTLDYDNSKLNYVKYMKRKELGLKMCKHILDRFDIGASQIAWDGNNIIMTKLGKFAIEYKSIIFNNKTYSKSTDFRITKYYERGFSLILLNTIPSLLEHLPNIRVVSNQYQYMYVSSNKSGISIKSSNYDSYEYQFLKGGIILHNFINFCINKFDSIVITENKYHFDDVYLILLDCIKRELKQKKYGKISHIFDTNSLIDIMFKEFDENKIKDILTDKIIKFITYMKTANFNIIHQVNDFNDLFDKRGIELEKWYGEAFISNVDC